MRRLWWLLIIDMPDESQPDLIKKARRANHLHSQFGSEDAANVVNARLESFGGRHEIVDLATSGGCCPRCGEELI